MHRSIKRTILRWLPAFAWMALLFWLSSQPDLPGPQNPLLDVLFKKTAHFGSYGVLALLYLFAFGAWHKRPQALLLTGLYAISDEYHQAWTPLRTPAPMDVLIDAAGATVALWLVAPCLLNSLQEQLKVWLAIPPQQVPKCTLQAINRFVAKPKTEQSADD